MTLAARTGRVAYETESSFGENTATWGTAVPHVGDVNELISGLVQPKQDAGYTRQYLNDGAMPIRMPMGGQFTIRLYLCGHGSSTDGATSATAKETLLANFFGAGAVSASSGDTFTGGTASVPTTTGASGFSAGSIGWGGVLGDGRGEGQAFAVGTHASNNLTLLTAMPGAPNAADVLYSGHTFYIEETPANADLVSSRWIFQTAALQKSAHGCFPMSATFSELGNGLVSMVDLTYGVSWWTYRAESIPGTAPTEAQPSSNTAGSFFIQNRGTVTRATKSIRDITVTYAMTVVPRMGPGGVNEFQTIVGATRAGGTVSLEVVYDSEAATTTPTEDATWTSDTQHKHILYSFSGHASGQRVAMYFPNVQVVGERPSQFNMDGLNRVRVFYRAVTGTTTTSEQTLSAMRIGMG